MAIYLDHQATTQLDDRVLQEMLPYFGVKFGNPHSVDHIVGWDSGRAVANATARVAELFGADADEIVFTSGATEANNLALLGLAGQHADKRRNRVIVSAIEHKSVLAPSTVLRDSLSYRIEKVPVDSQGCVSVEGLKDALDETVLAVSIMSVNNEIGTIQDLRELSDAAHSVGAVFHSDAAQAPFAMCMSGLAEIMDLMSLSGHKMGGPQGIGILYVRRDLRERIRPLIHGGEQQGGLRAGTVPLPLCVGMGAAAGLLQESDALESRLELGRRRDRFVERVCGLPWRISMNGPSRERRHPGNANLCFHGFSAHDILSALQPELAASTGSACTSGISAPSHVLKAIGMSSEAAEASIRFSLGRETRDDEVETAIHLLAEVLERLSGGSSLQMTS